MSAADLMQWPPVLTGVPLATVRSIQGQVDRDLATALDIRAKAASVAELWAAHEVVVYYRDILTACRRAVQRHRERTGWHNPRPRTAGSPYRAATSPHGVMPRRASAGLVAGTVGVAGAAPPPLMGHGWPASARAGSADGPTVRSEDAAHPRTRDVQPPAKPAFFCPEGERISNENSNVEAIHYA
jgi:hypothetical protein